MEKKVSIKVTLPPEEIITMRLLLCHVDGCSEYFSNASHLRMHLSRHHKLTPLSSSASAESDDQLKHFHCPEESCVYHIRASGEKFFTSFRSLKQHFLKMHSEKNFTCDNCNGQKSFATESLLRAHQSNCGQIFICEVCRFPYRSREALLTHAKRKNHSYEQLLALKGSKRRSVESKQEHSKILKKIDQSTVEVQTELSQNEQAKKSQVTQTDENQYDEALKNECSTQTVLIDSTSPHNTPTVDRFSQTTLKQLNYFEDSDPAYYDSPASPNCQQLSASSSEPTMFVCTETQTDLIYDTMFPNEDRTDPMLYSHMYTQTCDDIFSELGLATIETQTNWDGLGEFLVSTETQTNLNRSGSTDSGGVGMNAVQEQKGKITSIETQTCTSMEFLNAISAESSSTHTQTS